MSVQNSEQSNVQQPTSVQSGPVPPQILYTTTHPIRYYSPEYMASRMLIIILEEKKLFVLYNSEK